MKKFLCAVLAVATAVSFASCEFKSPANVVKVNGEDISSGLYLIYQYQQYSNAANKAEDTEKDLLKQNIDDVPASQWIHTETINAIKEHLYIEKTFTEQGLAFTDEELASFEKQASETYESNSKMFAKNGIGAETFKLFFLNARKGSKMFEKFSADEANAVTDDEAKKYLDENYTNIARISLPKTDKDNKALSEEKLAEINTIAKELEAEVNGGAEFNRELAEKYVEKLLAAAGREFNENSVDSYFSTSYISAEGVSYYYDDELKAEMLASALGSAKIADVNGTGFVWGHIKPIQSDEDFEDLKDSIVNEIQSKAYEAVVKAATDAYTCEEDAKAVGYYSVKKVKLS